MDCPFRTASFDLFGFRLRPLNSAFFRAHLEKCFVPERCEFQNSLKPAFPPADAPIKSNLKAPKKGINMVK